MVEKRGSGACSVACRLSKLFKIIYSFAETYLCVLMALCIRLNTDILLIVCNVYVAVLWVENQVNFLIRISFFSR